MTEPSAQTPATSDPHEHGPYAPVLPYDPAEVHHPAPVEPAAPPTGYGAPIYPPAPIAPEAAPVDEGARRHDGFFLRIQLGPGYFFDRRSIEREGLDLEIVSEIGGYATGFEFLAGGTVGSGIVIGGTLAFARVANYDRTVGAISAETADVIGFSLIGPFIDWYPDEEGGFHVFGTLALAGASSRDDDWEAGGLAFGAGAGYDWWIADEWSIGLLGKIVLAGLEDKTSTAERRLVNGIAVPTLMFGATYH